MKYTYVTQIPCDHDRGNALQMWRVTIICSMYTHSQSLRDGTPTFALGMEL